MKNAGRLSMAVPDPVAADVPEIAWVWELSDPIVCVCAPDDEVVLEALSPPVLPLL